MPEVRITEETIWYNHHYRKGDEVFVEGREYLDLLLAGRVVTDTAPAEKLPPVLGAREIEGRHRGETVFVFGNGPSLLAARDRRPELSAFTTIGINRSFRLLGTDYLLFLDRSVWAAHSQEILACGSLVFCPAKLHLPYFTQFARYRPMGRDDTLSERWRDGLFWSRSSAVPAINLAYIFGASEIVILGVDMRGQSHFYSGYGKNKRFPHADRIVEDLWLMSRRMKEKGVKLYNCSPDSAVRGFERLELGKLLARRARKAKHRKAQEVSNG